VQQQLIAGLLHLLFEVFDLLVDLLRVHLLVALRVRPRLVVQSVEPMALLEKHLEGATHPVIGSHHGMLCLPHPAYLSGQFPHRLHQPVHLVQERLVPRPSGPGLRWPHHLLDFVDDDDSRQLLDLLSFFTALWRCRDSLGLGLVHPGPGSPSLDLHLLALLLETGTPLAGALFGLLRVLHALHPELGTAHAT